VLTNEVLTGMKVRLYSLWLLILVVCLLKEYKVLFW
jgi:hypothetical protein